MTTISLRTYIYKGVYDEQLETEFRDFMQSTCRVGMTPFRRLNHVEFLSLEPIGIYDRLIYDYHLKEAYYIGGQDYPSEILTLKKFMLK